MAQPIVGNYYTLTVMGHDIYYGKCIGITYADYKRAGIVNHRRIVAFFSPDDTVSHNICDYATAELEYVNDDNFAKLTRVESQQITTGGNSSSSSSPPLTGGRRRNSKKVKKAKKVKKQSRRRV
jgi:hypothetical protein